ncbi:hypothetical protein PR048_028711 [Dryococelus australis]|uniref:Uncharacterized protein n=1 Tax=Dryococelus australis TaxID=614101 RepID=A0ABQ9GF62_9NEOP|nr:hypothetical protein PR048_028711 [Dryococelus australis]
MAARISSCDEDGAVAECKGERNGSAPRKPNGEKQRPPRFPGAKIRVNTSASESGFALMRGDYHTTGRSQSRTCIIFLMPECCLLLQSLFIEVLFYEIRLARGGGVQELLSTKCVSVASNISALHLPWKSNLKIMKTDLECGCECGLNPLSQFANSCHALFCNLCFEVRPRSITTCDQVQRHGGNTARHAGRSDEALGVRVSVARIAPSLLDLGRRVSTRVYPTLKSETRCVARCGGGTPIHSVPRAVKALKTGLYKLPSTAIGHVPLLRYGKRSVKPGQQWVQQHTLVTGAGIKYDCLQRRRSVIETAKSKRGVGAREKINAAGRNRRKPQRIERTRERGRTWERLAEGMPEPGGKKGNSERKKVTQDSRHFCGMTRAQGFSLTSSKMAARSRKFAIKAADSVFSSALCQEFPIREARSQFTKADSARLARPTTARTQLPAAPDGNDEEKVGLRETCSNQACPDAAKRSRESKEDKHSRRPVSRSELTRRLLKAHDELLATCVTPPLVTSALRRVCNLPFLWMWTCLKRHIHEVPIWSTNASSEVSFQNLTLDSNKSVLRARGREDTRWWRHAGNNTMVRREWNDEDNEQCWRGGEGRFVMILGGASRAVDVAEIWRPEKCSELTPRQWLACLPPTKANRVQTLAGPLPDFRMWELCQTMSLIGGWFSRGSPVSPAISFRRSSILTLITLIGSQDLDLSGQERKRKRVNLHFHRHLAFNHVYQWRVVNCWKVCWCLHTAVHSRCSQQELVTTVQHRESLNTSCDVTCPTMFLLGGIANQQATEYSTELTPVYLATGLPHATGCTPLTAARCLWRV